MHQKMDKLSKKMDNFLIISVKVVLSINKVIYNYTVEKIYLQIGYC
jgi:hypothetical protein